MQEAGRAPKDAKKRIVVLSGKDLRRSHEHALISVFGGNIQGIQGNGRLAGANIPLQQTVHGKWSRHVALDLAHHTKLRLRRRKGQFPQIPFPRAFRKDEMPVKRLRSCFCNSTASR